MIERFLLYPSHSARLLSIKNSIYTVVGSLTATAQPSKEPIPFAEIDVQNFKPVNKGFIWGGMFDCCWFNLKGSVPTSAAGKHIVLIIDVMGEGAVYDLNDNGDIKTGITLVLSGIDAVQSTKGKQIVDMFYNAKGGEDLNVLVDAGNNGHNGNAFPTAKLNRKDIAVKNDTVYGYYYDYLTLFALLLTKGKNKLLTNERAAEINKALDQSFKLYVKKDYEGARAVLASQFGSDQKQKAVNYYAVGHAHLDLGWLWPIRETKRKAVRTFSTAVKNIEKYPNYIFGASQAQQFEWVKREYPQFYPKLKSAVIGGNIEIQGGMWTENDSNVPCGESLIRQFVYGDGFFFEEFNRRSKMVWLPDAFGFPASLPQIYRGCEKDYFMTIKLTWNEHNEFPYKTFRWKGIDGSEVLAHMAPQGDYNSSGSPLAVIKSEKGFKQGKELDKALLCYGVGDGGGGPGEGHLEYVEREKNIVGLNPVKMSPAQNFFDDLSADMAKIPTYEGELYLEKHQGTYTSQGRNKQYNYLLERELHSVEWLGAVALTKSLSYPKAEVDEIWKEVLLYQFHDILPGSSINRIYTESLERYKILLEQAAAIKNDLIATIGGAEQKCLLNPTSFAFSGYGKAFEKWYKIEAKPYSAAKMKKADADASRLICGENTIENDLVKLEFDAKGVIVSMIDKATGKQLNKGGLNRLIVYTDPRTHYNAWDIKDDYLNRKKTYPKLAKRKSFVDGKSVVMENVFAVGGSVINQKITLIEGDAFVKIDTEADWREKHKMLRAEFLPTVFSDTVNCDIQFGSFDRSTKNETSIERAQYEICAHKYVAVGGDDYGFAVIKNCKFGHRVKDGVISLNLLRSPVYPDPMCDRGKHSFSYGVYAFSGKREDSKLVKTAYELSYPLQESAIDVGENSLLCLDNDNVVIETIKPSEDGKGVVARLYERYGRSESCALTASFKYKALSQTNMLERQAKPCGTNLKFAPFEIKTLYFEL